MPEWKTFFCVRTPHTEVGGMVHKKTVVADANGITFVTLHGYNGQPFKNITNLLEHVKAVLRAIPSPLTPVIFAGDFNT